MNGICQRMVISGLLVVSAASAAPSELLGHFPRPKPGQVATVPVYGCPVAPAECVVEVSVTAGPPGKLNECKFVLRNGTQEFFYIDLNHGKDGEQIVAWSLAPGTNAAFDTRGGSQGIHFTEGNDHAASAPPLPSPPPPNLTQRRTIRKDATTAPRRSLLLYDIYVTLTPTSGSQIPCDPYGPGIINRGD